AQRRHEPGENLHHLVRVKQTKHAAEAVVGWSAMLEIDDLGKDRLIGSSKIGKIDARLRSTQRCRQTNEHHSRQIMVRIEGPRIADFTKDRDQRFHRGLPESGKPSSESTFTSGAIPFYLPAIPLPSRGG